MSRTVSVGAMIKQLDGLRGTGDLSEWEEDFVKSVVGWSKGGTATQWITERQIEVVERIYGKHFA
jgi:hypothetical protein